MPTIIPITDFAAPELDIYARLTENQLVQPDELKELVAFRLLQGMTCQSRIESPLRGAHRINSSPVRLDTTTNWIKLFRQT